MLRQSLRNYYLRSGKAQTPGHAVYLTEMFTQRLLTRLAQIALLLGFLGTWEAIVHYRLMDVFLISSPRRVWQTVLWLHADGALYWHVGVTTLETIVGFVSGTLIGTFSAALLWWRPSLFAVADPYLTVLNSLPKIVLGPLFIIWFGTGYVTIIVMALAISLITTIIVVHSGFLHVDPLKLKLARAFGATKWQTFSLIVLPGSLPTIVSALKVNVGLSWVGVIVGEFLVSRAGLGYLAIYGGQVLNMHLVMTSVFLLAVCATVMYQAVALLEQKVKARHQTD
ncbi:MAG: putative aliphatic sulfonates transport permease protein SsuC [Firmicutes bacterium]|nr:putative aliphatic sulfonates transport permease protein SsuC [candidate division NPL-UPA2 bacterium]